MLFFDGGGTVGRVGRQHGVLAQVLGGLRQRCSGCRASGPRSFGAEKRQLHLVHVGIVRHGRDVGIGELLERLGLPVIRPVSGLS